MSSPGQPCAVQPEDLFRFVFLQGGRLSPDGKSVVYQVAHVERDEADGNEEPAEHKEYVALWLLSLATGESRQLTAGTARDANPRWSPDGKQIAFLSTRGDKTQIYLIPVDGGEARALTSLRSSQWVRPSSRRNLAASQMSSLMASVGAQIVVLFSIEIPNYQLLT